MELRGQKALVTGATGGLGHAIARALAERGARVVVTGRRAEVLEPLAEEIGGRAVAADLSEPDAVDRLLAEAGEVDVLVANAGLPASGRIDDYSVEQIDRALAVNLRAPVLMAHALGPKMAERGRGHMVFMSSMSGKVATKASALYAATKFGLRGFAMGLRQDLDGTGVGVSAVFPGPVSDAGMFAETGVEMPWFARPRSPEDVAAAVVRAIDRNRAEIDVAPMTMRVAGRAIGVAPNAVLRIGSRIGADEIAAEITEAQRDKR